MANNNNNNTNPKRENRRVVTLSGRQWAIKKFDAFTGSYIAYALLGQMLPGGMDSMVRGETSEKPTSIMSKKDFISIQKDCLSVCYEVLPAGDIPIIGENGNWGVQNIENDSSTVIALTIHALLFNISSFFKGGALADLTKGLSDLSGTNL